MPLKSAGRGISKRNVLFCIGKIDVIEIFSNDLPVSLLVLDGFIELFHATDTEETDGARFRSSATRKAITKVHIFSVIRFSTF